MTNDPMHGLTDAAKCPLRSGDLLLTDNGKVFVAHPTDRLTAAQCVAVVTPAVRRRTGRWESVGETTYARTGNVIRVQWQSLTTSNRTELARLFQTLYAAMVAPASRAELAARKQAIKDHKAWIKEEQA